MLRVVSAPSFCFTAGLLFLCLSCRPQRPIRPAPLPGCGRDTDCKGSRVCDRGQCVELLKTPPVPPPTAPPAVPVITQPGPNGPSGLVPMFRGDPQHTGRSPYHAPAQVPHEVWRYATQGTVYGAAAIATDGTILFGSHDHQVYALTPDGLLRWKRLTGDLVWSTPALAGGGVAYVGSDDDRVYALGMADGAVRWSLSPGSCRRSVGIGPEAVRCDVDQLTLGPDGTVYVGGDGIYALRPDGTVRWRFSPGNKVHCAGAPAVGQDGAVYAGCQDDGFYALNPDGTKRWEYRGQDDFDSSAAIGPDGTIYVGSDDRRLYALTPEGRLRFAVVTEGAVRASPAVAIDGTVYVASLDGALYAVRPDGGVAWSYRTADRVQSSPLVDAGGVVLFGSQDDRLYAILPDGKLLWSVLLDGDVDGSPVLGPDGTIYVGADDQALHALR